MVTTPNRAEKKYAGIIDVTACVARTSIHEMGHTILGGGHPDDMGGGPSRYGNDGMGPGIMTSGNYPKSPFPRDIMKDSMKFHKIDKDKLWEFFNTRGSEYGPDGQFRWKEAPPPKDNLSSKLKK